MEQSYKACVTLDGGWIWRMSHVTELRMKMSEVLSSHTRTRMGPRKIALVNLHVMILRPKLTLAIHFILPRFARIDFHGHQNYAPKTADRKMDDRNKNLKFLK